MSISNISENRRKSLAARGAGVVRELKEAGMGTDKAGETWDLRHARHRPWALTEQQCRTLKGFKQVKDNLICTLRSALDAVWRTAWSTVRNGEIKATLCQQAR